MDSTEDEPPAPIAWFVAAIADADGRHIADAWTESADGELMVAIRNALPDLLKLARAVEAILPYIPTDDLMVYGKVAAVTAAMDLRTALEPLFREVPT